MDMVETAVGCVKLLERCRHVRADLGGLTGRAGLDPFLDVSVHQRPNEACCDELSGSDAARMREPMEGIENWTAPGSWNQWSGAALTGVAEESGAANHDVLEDQACVALGPEGEDVIVRLLSQRHVGKVDCPWDDGVDVGLVGARQGIGHYVVLAWEMAEISRELSDVREVAVLSRGVGDVRGQNGGQRLVVREHLERAPLKKESETADGQVDSEQLTVEG